MQEYDANEEYDASSFEWGKMNTVQGIKSTRHRSICSKSNPHLGCGIAQ